MRRLLFLVMLMTLLAISTPVQALIIGPDWVKFHPDTKEVIGGATATITDILGGVRIVMDVTNFPTGSQDITEWYFNVGSDTLLNTAAFNYISGVHATAITLQDQADGDGVFDLHLAFGTSGSDTFTTLKVSTYDILVAGLDAADFDSLSADKGGAGPFVSAIKNGEAFWAEGGAATVPEPSTLLLLGAALIGLVGVRRFRK